MSIDNISSNIDGMQNEEVDPKNQSNKTGKTEKNESVGSGFKDKQSSSRTLKSLSELTTDEMNKLLMTEVQKICNESRKHTEKLKKKWRGQPE